MDHISFYIVFIAATVINLPFGYYRAGQRRLSWQWFVAIHAPVPLVIALRLVSHIGWSVVPLLIISALLGQLAGGWLHNTLQPATARETNE